MCTALRTAHACICLNPRACPPIIMHAPVFAYLRENIVTTTGPAVRWLREAQTQSPAFKSETPNLNQNVKPPQTRPLSFALPDAVVRMLVLRMFILLCCIHCATAGGRVAREECQEALLTSHFALHAPCSSSVRGVACECARDGPRDTHATRAALQKTLSVLSKAKPIIDLYPRRFRPLLHSEPGGLPHQTDTHRFEYRLSVLS